jgi:tetratricopeptide (TPR) repeat protein
MRLSDRFDTRLAARAGAIGLAIGAVVAGAIACLCIPAHPAPHSELAPEPAALRYRYAIAKPSDAAADTAGMIAALEARVRDLASPFDYAELADLYVGRAKLDGDARGYQTAEAMARRSLALLPTPNPAVLTLARLADARHEFRAAIELAHQHKSRSAGAQIIVATAELALGELAAAGEAAEAALAIKPDAAGYLTRALVMQAQGRDAEAAFDFASAARVEQPGDLQGSARLRALWGRFLLRRGELAGARALFEEALRIAPGFPLGLAYRGELALRTGHPGDAARWFEQAFAASRQVRYLIDQARALELGGDLTGADALRSQVEAIVRGELGEGGLGHRLDLAEVLIDRGQPAQIAEAVALARDQVDQRTSFEARFQLARALARSGARDEALRQVQAALASGAREAQLYELAAQLEAQRGNPAAAALYTREADRIDPGHSGWRKLGLGQPAPQQQRQPALAQPALAQPALAQPAFAQPAFAQPALAQPALAQPAFAQPAFAQPALAQPALAQPGQEQP